MALHRKLAAIMFTDIEGYTALMQRDEMAAFDMRKKHRAVFEKCTRAHSGQILQYYGDGTLSVFDSAIEAVHCGIELQKAFRENPSIPVRIGIHLGDIFFDHDDVGGDGVNVASRIESLARAGSVLISAKVNDEIKNQPDITTRKFGDFKLKNVEEITAVFGIVDPELTFPDAVGAQAKGYKVEKPFKRLAQKYSWVMAMVIAVAAIFYFMENGPTPSAHSTGKSIAVLPFMNIGNDPQQEYFSDGITEDILSRISQIDDLKVISRTTSWRYKNTTLSVPEIGKELGVDNILEGSVRRTDDQIRVIAQLISTQTDEQLWSKTYDRKSDEIFAVQSEIAEDIAGILAAEFTILQQTAASPPPNSSQVSAYDYYLKGRNVLENWSTQSDLDIAVELFRQALIEDPNYAEAYADLGRAYFHKHGLGRSSSNWVDSAIVLVRKAIEINPNLPEAYLTRAMIFNSSAINVPEAAQKDLFKAYELDPNNSQALLYVGLYYFETGDFQQGIDMIIKSLEVEPDKADPQIYLVWANIYEFIDSIDLALEYYQQALKLKPFGVEILFELSNLLRQEKQYEEALVYAQRIAKVDRTLLAQDYLAWSYLLNGHLQPAYDSWARMAELEQNYHPSQRIFYRHRLAYVLWQLDQKEEARKIFEEQRVLLRKNIESDQITNTAGEYYDLAGINAFLGNEKLALNWLEQASEEGFFDLELINIDPLFDNIRNHRQFQEMIQSRQAKWERQNRRMDTGREVVRQKLRSLEDKVPMV